MGSSLIKLGKRRAISYGLIHTGFHGSPSIFALEDDCLPSLDCIVHCIFAFSLLYSGEEARCT